MLTAYDKMTPNEKTASAPVVSRADRDRGGRRRLPAGIAASEPSKPVPANRNKNIVDRTAATLSPNVSGAEAAAAAVDDDAVDDDRVWEPPGVAAATNSDDDGEPSHPLARGTRNGSLSER
jgi:hypothetical protein